VNLPPIEIITSLKYSKSVFSLNNMLEEGGVRLFSLVDNETKKGYLYFIGGF
jgi:hypothetical protein